MRAKPGKVENGEQFDKFNFISKIGKHGDIDCKHFKVRFSCNV